MTHKPRLKLFDEQISLKPNLYPWTKDFNKAMHDGHWTSDDFDFHSDKIDYLTHITPEEQEIIKKVFSAISQVEVAVKTFWAKLGDNLPHPGIRDMGYVMANIEVIHNDAYSKLMEVLGFDDVFEENLKLDVMRGRVEYLRKHTHRQYTNSKKQYIYAIILFTLFVENVSLFSQFYTGMWFYKHKNLFKKTAQQIKYTCREEQLHAMIGIKLIQTLRAEYPELFDQDLEDKILLEAKSAFEAESKIVDWMLGDYNQPDLNAPLLKQYIAHRLNTSLVDIGYKSLFDVSEHDVQLTSWLDEMTIGKMKTDFFHAKPTDYNMRKITQEEIFN